MLLCVRWYMAYSRSLWDLEEMMAERAIGVDHSTVHRWVIKLVPLFEKTFRKHKLPVGKSWCMDETDLGRERVPDGTTLLKFRRLLERKKLGEQLFGRVDRG